MPMFAKKSSGSAEAVEGQSQGFGFAPVNTGELQEQFTELKEDVEAKVIEAQHLKATLEDKVCTCS